MKLEPWSYKALRDTMDGFCWQSAGSAAAENAEWVKWNTRWRAPGSFETDSNRLSYGS